MNRRDFIQLAALSLLPALALSCGVSTTSRRREYDIVLTSDMSSGHRVMTSQDFPSAAPESHEVVVIGGGIAGLSAAWALRDQNPLLLELSTQLGGTSGAATHQNTTFAQGAHYDLSYPENYGAEGLQCLRALNIIEENPHNGLWNFVDKHYLIDDKFESQVSAFGQKRPTLFPASRATKQFQDIIAPYHGQMPMPTRIIAPELQDLNGVNFRSWLTDRMDLDPDFEEALDYQMRDDYGGSAAEVSALAGLHYFTCRPYGIKPLELFSPPQGNQYFVQKLANALPENAAQVQQMVHRITPNKGSFTLDVLDLKNQQKRQINTQKVVMAGAKHVFKYLLPEVYPSFAKTAYTPWMVINVVLKFPTQKAAYWQNEMLTSRHDFLGFVDSASQADRDGEYRVLSAYYCFRPEERANLVNLPNRLQEVAADTMDLINDYFGQDLNPLVEKIYIKLMGHAMPVPAPNYLLHDHNDNRTYENLVYAGVDNGRLPLLFEAMDSGLMAAELLKK